MSEKDRYPDIAFDELSTLYKNDPDKFEEQRRALIDQTIENFPEDCRRRAQGLQFTIDCKLDRYKDPIMRMNKMVEIFWEHFSVFQETINDPEKVLQERRAARQGAKVISLHSRSERDRPWGETH
ncbi:DUF3135 domain-containing protein [Geoalkalibacter halelectricus]|uniref:DUF3135 domain-containing protein n=1 Tax=Geoalkalibacter halelectricus TaxID=2847045 RepID=A0ABY5ZV29_9BACT|nr:DUF3135 domain-containing protein [Geoalkalibacter halelectricus]MDO3379310.1 DUF3135 domain-containing protein [Geoalkalibacter halelectricus]UWZ81066.1 DUF3135 domain-containing protein [Geoalkalibacter halelectricus]